MEPLEAFATMGRTVIDKFVPLFLAVSLFVGAGFQHSPANMAYFSLAAGAGLGPGCGAAVGWNIAPGSPRKSPRGLAARRRSVLDRLRLQAQRDAR